MRIIAVLALLAGLCCTAVAFSSDDVVVTESSGNEYRAGLDRYHNADYTASISHFQKAFKLDERNINALFAHGLALSNLNLNEEAADQFELVLDRDPTHKKALTMLLTVLAASDDLTHLLNAYDRGIAAMPDDYSFYYGKAVAYIKNGNHSNALPLLEKAIGLAPGMVELRERLMFTYREIGDRENTARTARNILRIDQNHSSAHLILADYNRESGNYRQALRDYEIAAREFEAKSYADYYIEVINQELEALDIEREYQERMEKRRSDQ